MIKWGSFKMSVDHRLWYNYQLILTQNELFLVPLQKSANRQFLRSTYNPCLTSSWHLWWFSTEPSQMRNMDSLVMRSLVRGSTSHILPRLRGNLMSDNERHWLIVSPIIQSESLIITDVLPMRAYHEPTAYNLQIVPTTLCWLCQRKPTATWDLPIPRSSK